MLPVSCEVLMTHQLNLVESQVWKNLEIQRGNADGPDTDFDKLDDVSFGDTVAIDWQGELDGITDYGYVFGWPGIDESGDANLAGIIHIPYPQNPGGKGNSPSEWATLHDLSLNPLVKRVRRVTEWRSVVQQVLKK
jgi:hypothetical protein